MYFTFKNQSEINSAEWKKDFHQMLLSELINYDYTHFQPVFMYIHATSCLTYKPTTNKSFRDRGSVTKKNMRKNSPHQWLMKWIPSNSIWCIIFHSFAHSLSLAIVLFTTPADDGRQQRWRHRGVATECPRSYDAHLSATPTVRVSHTKINGNSRQYTHSAQNEK